MPVWAKGPGRHGQYHEHSPPGILPTDEALPRTVPREVVCAGRSVRTARPTGPPPTASSWACEGRGKPYLLTSVWLPRGEEAPCCRAAGRRGRRVGRRARLRGVLARGRAARAGGSLGRGVRPSEGSAPRFLASDFLAPRLLKTGGRDSALPGCWPGARSSRAHRVFQRHHRGSRGEILISGLVAKPGLAFSWASVTGRCSASRSAWRVHPDPLAGPDR